MRVIQAYAEEYGSDFKLSNKTWTVKFTGKLSKNSEDEERKEEDQDDLQDASQETLFG